MQFRQNVQLLNQRILIFFLMSMSLSSWSQAMLEEGLTRDQITQCDLEFNYHLLQQTLLNRETEEMGQFFEGCSIRETESFQEMQKVFERVKQSELAARKQEMIREDMEKFKIHLAEQIIHSELGKIVEQAKTKAFCLGAKSGNIMKAGILAKTAAERIIEKARTQARSERATDAEAAEEAAAAAREIARKNRWFSFCTIG